MRTIAKTARTLRRHLVSAMGIPAKNAQNACNTQTAQTGAEQ